MQFVEIAERNVTVELSPEDCQVLAKAITHAIECDIQPFSMQQVLEAMGSALEAAALAAGSYSRGAEDATLTALRAGKVIDRVA